MLLQKMLAVLKKKIFCLGKFKVKHFDPRFPFSPTSFCLSEPKKLNN